MFSITISATRKPGMSEDAYHTYISETHAGHLKHLLVQKKIVDYTMVSRVALSFMPTVEANVGTSNTTRLRQ